MTTCRNWKVQYPLPWGAFRRSSNWTSPGMHSLVSQPRSQGCYGVTLSCAAMALFRTTLWWTYRPNLSRVLSAPSSRSPAGCIPPEIGHLACLQLLNLASNCLSGEPRVVDVHGPSSRR